LEYKMAKQYNGKIRAIYSDCVLLGINEFITSLVASGMTQEDASEAAPTLKVATADFKAFKQEHGITDAGGSIAYTCSIGRIKKADGSYSTDYVGAVDFKGHAYDSGAPEVEVLDEAEYEAWAASLGAG
jgi:hypothetical protein